MPVSSPEERRAKAVARVTSLKTIPALPAVMASIQTVINDPKASANHVASMVASDPGLAARILRASNSAIYAFRGTVTNLPQAVVALGFHTISTLVLASSVVNVFEKSSLANVNRLWEHSVRAGCGCRILAEYIGERAKREDYFVAGLLHDMGRLLIDQYLTEDAVQIQKMVTEQGLSQHDAEVQHMGIHHGELGGVLLEHWRLDAALCASVLHYHAPADAGPHQKQATTVQLADIIALVSAAEESQVESIWATVPDETWAMFPAIQNEKADIVLRVMEEFERAKEFLDMSNRKAAAKVAPKKK